MKCPRCKLTEMIVNSVLDNKVKHYCKNCGNEEITEIQGKSDAQDSV